MFIDDDLVNFLKSCYSIGGNCIYITDLENVRGFCQNKFEEFNKPISRELLQTILNISIDGYSGAFIMINEKNKIIPVFEDSSLNIDWKAQIILPIWYDDSIHGTIIFTNFHKTFHEKHLEFAKITQKFVKTILLKQINKNYIEEEKVDEEEW